MNKRTIWFAGVLTQGHLQPQTTNLTCDMWKTWWKHVNIPRNSSRNSPPTAIPQHVSRTNQDWRHWLAAGLRYHGRVQEPQLRPPSPRYMPFPQATQHKSQKSASCEDVESWGRDPSLEGTGDTQLPPIWNHMLPSLAQNQTNGSQTTDENNQGSEVLKWSWPAFHDVFQNGPMTWNEIFFALVNFSRWGMRWTRWSEKMCPDLVPVLAERPWRLQWGQTWYVRTHGSGVNMSE